MSQRNQPSQTGGARGRLRSVALLLVLGACVCVAASRASIAEDELDPIDSINVVVYGAEPGVTMTGARAVALDREHREIWIANPDVHRIDVYAYDGRGLAHYAHRVRLADGTLVDGQPVGLALDPSGRIFVVDNLATYVDVLDYRARPIDRIDLPLAPEAAAEDRGPAAVAVGHDGSILVAARGDSGRIHVFDRDLQPVRTWGIPGEEAGQLRSICGLAEAPDGRVVVLAHRTKLVVQIFTPSGEFLRGFGIRDIGPGNFSVPSGLVITDDGRIWVSDEIRQLVQVFDPDGKYLGAVGGWGTAPGEFLYPSALAADGKAHLAVVERVGGRFQLMTIRSAQRIGQDNERR